MPFPRFVNVGLSTVKPTTSTNYLLDRSDTDDHEIWTNAEDASTTIHVGQLVDLVRPLARAR